MAKEYFSGQGRVSIARRNTLGRPDNDGFTFMGNCSKLMADATVDVVKHNESQTGKNAVDNRFEKTQEIKVEATFDELLPAAINRFLYADTYKLSARTFSDWVIRAAHGKEVPLGRIPDLSQDLIITNQAKTVTYSEGVHYSVSPTGMVYFAVPGQSANPASGAEQAPPETGAEQTPPETGGDAETPAETGGDAGAAETGGDAGTAETGGDAGTAQSGGNAGANGSPNNGQVLLVSYAARTERITTAFTGRSEEFYLRFDGLNRAKDDSPVVIELFKTRFDPSSIEAINDEYATYDLSGDVLYDSFNASSDQYGGFMRIRLIPG